MGVYERDICTHRTYINPSLALGLALGLAGLIAPTLAHFCCFEFQTFPVSVLLVRPTAVGFRSMELVKVSDGISGWATGAKESTRGVVVIQEWWGVTTIVKDHASYIAERCHARCFIPDIYHGKSTVDKEEASHLMNNLDWQRAVQEINECVEFLRRSGCKHVGVVGFCMGGALACAVGQHGNVDCAVAFYGTPPAGLAQPENVHVPMQLHCGPLDDHAGFSDVDTVEAWAGKCASATAYVDYEGCGHGFLNTGELAAELRAKMGFPTPSKDMQTRAWDRLAAFFEKHLG